MFLFPTGVANQNALCCSHASPFILKHPSIFCRYLRYRVLHPFRDGSSNPTPPPPTAHHWRKQIGNEGQDFCLYFHLYVNPSPDLGRSLSDSGVGLGNAFSRTYSDDGGGEGGSLYILVAQKQSIIFTGLAACRPIQTP